MGAGTPGNVRDLGAWDSPVSASPVPSEAQMVGFPSTRQFVAQEPFAGRFLDRLLFCLCLGPVIPDGWQQAQRLDSRTHFTGHLAGQEEALGDGQGPRASRRWPS